MRFIMSLILVCLLAGYSFAGPCDTCPVAGQCGVSACDTSAPRAIVAPVKVVAKAAKMVRRVGPVRRALKVVKVLKVVRVLKVLKWRPLKQLRHRQPVRRALGKVFRYHRPVKRITHMVTGRYR